MCEAEIFGKGKQYFKIVLLLLFFQNWAQGQTLPTLIAQPCDYCIGEEVAINITGAINNGDTSTVYALTTEYGEILATNSTGNFGNALSAGGYLIYGIIYDNTGTVTNLGVGDTITNTMSNSCLEFTDPLPMVICYLDTLSSSETVSLSNTPPTGKSCFYVLTNTLGKVIDTSVVASSLVLPDTNNANLYVYYFCSDDAPNSGIMTGDTITNETPAGNFTWSAPYPIYLASEIIMEEGGTLPTLIAQPCDYCIGEEVAINITGAINNGDTSTVYALTTEYGEILATNSTGNFGNALSAGGYLIYGIIYDNTGTVTNLGVGDTITNTMSNSCLEFTDPLPMVICYADTLNPSETVSLSNTPPAGRSCFYVLTDTLGKVIDTSVVASSLMLPDTNNADLFVYYFCSDDAPNSGIMLGDTITNETPAGNFTWSDPYPIRIPNEQILITELQLCTPQQQIELYNPGTSTIDLTNWYLCNGTTYQQIGGLTPVSGSIMLGAGQYLVLTWSGINITSGEIALYNTNADYTNANNIKDYVQYNTSNSTRASVAVAAGIWPSVTDNIYAPPASEGSGCNPVSIQNTTAMTSSAISPSDWCVATASFGSANNTCLVPEITIDDQTIAEGGTATFTVSLSAPIGMDVMVTYTTVDSSATTADGDYVAATGIVTILAR